ncbi:MAG: hypothetical protein AABP62_12895 [Planctomycetota bacterium]
MSFPWQGPSVGWEAVPLGTDGSRAVWGWFKPPHAPNSVALQVPPEVWSRGDSSQPITVRLLAAAAGVTVLLGWTIGGQFYPLDERTAPFIDVPLAPPPAGVDPSIILWSGEAETMPMAAPMPEYSPFPAATGASDLLPGEDPGPLFETIVSLWGAIQHIETDVRRVRGQLEQATNKLSSLNRDLKPEEQLAADTLDKKDWMDARRWMRDSSAVLSKSIKQIDVGIISGAGQRHRFVDIIQQYVEPRIPFPGLKQSVIDFEMHHRSVKNVLMAAQTALAKGSADGERRANAVLQRIAAKTRQRRNNARGSNA